MAWTECESVGSHRAELTQVPGRLAPAWRELRAVLNGLNRGGSSSDAQRFSTRSTSRLRNFSSPSARFARNSANSPVSGRREFSMPTS